MLMRFNTKRGGFAPPLRAALLAAALALPVVGCDSLLEVDDEDVTRDENFADLTSLTSLRAAAIGDFFVGYENMIFYGGMLGDEWIFSETFPTRLEVDKRAIDTNNGTLLGVFSSVATAGASADFINARYDVVDPGNTAKFQRAEARNLAGYAFIFFAENYCEGVPISRLQRTDAGALTFVYGPGLTREQMLDSALARFDAAIAALPATGRTANETVQARLAAIGRGRVFQNKGQWANALAAVAGIPLTYTYVINHSANSGGENNIIWGFNRSTERMSVSYQPNSGGTAVAGDREGGNGLPWIANRAAQGHPLGPGVSTTSAPRARDPRVLWFRNSGAATSTTPGNDVGFDNSTPQLDALKYPDRPAFTVLASGVESRLIAAEAQLNLGNPQAMLDSLNVLRSQVQPLMQLLNYDYVNQQQLVGYAPGQSAVLAPIAALPATFAAQRDLFFEERAYWLWLTAHRLGDMRRLIRQYGRLEDQVFPTGFHFKGGPYGDDVNLPIPIQEEANPTAIGQCINRNA
ncbi:MAG TPA: hypothetical protein VF746_13520 [Longimicrobium sp.]|jgi:hypothetical protein